MFTVRLVVNDVFCYPVSLCNGARSAPRNQEAPS